MHPIFQSKKFLASALATLIAFLCTQQGMTTAETTFILAPLVAYIGAQGVADFGSSRAKVEAQASADLLARRASTGASSNASNPTPPQKP